MPSRVLAKKYINKQISKKKKRKKWGNCKTNYVGFIAQTVADARTFRVTTLGLKDKFE